MNYYEIKNVNLEKPFSVAKELFHNSFRRFDGDANFINRNPGSNIGIHPFKQGLFISWKPRAKKILFKEFKKIFSCPFYNINVFYTPAKGFYNWHTEGTQNLHRGPKELSTAVSLLKLRRNCAINYTLTDNDLSKSKLCWGEPLPEIKQLLDDNYRKIDIDGTGVNKKNKNSVTDRGILEVDNKIGLSIGFESVSDHNLVTKVDEYVGLDVPLLIRTDMFHMVDNSECEFDRIVGTVSFEPGMLIEDAKDMITNMAK